VPGLLLMAVATVRARVPRAVSGSQTGES